MIDKSNVVQIMIVGAGQAGKELLDDIHRNYLSFNVLCIIDDDPMLYGKELNGVKIVGNRHDIIKYANRFSIDQIVLAIPSASPDNRKDILEICKKTKCKLRSLPSRKEFIDPDVSVRLIRDINLNDLLGRSPIDIDKVCTDYLNRKIVLVTGGGGSIGSELCRQIASADPKLLIIFDIYENTAYDIEQELKFKYPNLNLIVLIGSVRDQNRVDHIFEKYRPEIVYHAAAHKHVPLMETSAHEAIKNNVGGTYNVALAADRYKCKNFVLISTDKAVRPTNIMGASKRLCELIIQVMACKSRTNYAAVRFGNVLGSNGSVIPLFKKQIEAGGPVTITHKDIIRFFMTIEEAVSLVLQAGAFAKGGEIFVLNMGEPVKIYDMALNLIRLSGYVPNVDIEIIETGLRPGEKLYEELLMDEEGLNKTLNNKIFIAKPFNNTSVAFLNEIENLIELSYDEEYNIILKVKEMIPEYNPEMREALCH